MRKSFYDFTSLCIDEAHIKLNECQDYQKLQETIERLEEILLSRLGEKEKAVYEKLEELKNLRNGIVETYVFVEGFRAALEAKEPLQFPQYGEPIGEICREALEAAFTPEKHN